MPVESPAIETQLTETLVSFQNSQGLELQATLLKLTRFQVSFEVYSASGALRMSEALENFKIVIQNEPIYCGRAVITNFIQLGSVSVCEAMLEEASFDLTRVGPASDTSSLLSRFEHFMRDWGRNFKLHSEFKLIMADMQTFFMDLRLWMEQMELAVRSQPSGDRLQMERDILLGLTEPVLPAAEALLEKFETIANEIQPDLRPAHRNYMKRQIHPLVLCSPFLYRTFQKPLGYAGDYEMVSMMMRDPFEGASMFAKLVNRIFLNTSPVVAHQNRIIYLSGHLAAEARRVALKGQGLRVYNLGCGPAREIHHFLAEQDLSDRAHFTLLDFNDETLAYTTRILGEAKTRAQRATAIQMVKKSVHQILKDSSKAGTAPKYDLVYCAGLFDYLSDQVCKRLMNYLYDLVMPGGLLISTNVSTANPSRNWMEYVLDWHLIYRSTAQFAALAPDRAPPDSYSVQAIGAGVNIAIEVRKPDHAN
ncbi:MAG: extracellular factor 3-hydroxypalmitic acid methyl ester biosynthesis protein [Verrucomicrobiota bacterium]